MGVTSGFSGLIGDTYFGEHPDDTPNAAKVTHSPLNDVNSGAAVLHLIEVDLSDNPIEDCWFRGYDDAAPTVGTTKEKIGFKCRKGEWTRLVIDPSYNMATAFSYCLTQEALGDSGTGTAPSGKAYVKGILA